MEARDLSFLTEQLAGSTLTAAEAVRRASCWWNDVGRGLINTSFNHATHKRFRHGAGKSASIRVIDTERDVIPSRILEARPWEELDRRERELIVKSWLESYRAEYVVVH